MLLLLLQLDILSLLGTSRVLGTMLRMTTQTSTSQFSDILCIIKMGRIAELRLHRVGWLYTPSLLPVGPLSILAIGFHGSSGKGWSVSEILQFAEKPFCQGCSATEKVLRMHWPIDSKPQKPKLSSIIRFLLLRIVNSSYLWALTWVSLKYMASKQSQGSGWPSPLVPQDEYEMQLSSDPWRTLKRWDVLLQSSGRNMAMACSGWQWRLDIGNRKKGEQIWGLVIMEIESEYLEFHSFILVAFHA